MRLTLFPCHREGVDCQVLADGSGMLYDPSVLTFYALSASAVLVWSACDGVNSPAAIAGELAAVYDAPLPLILRDVEALLADLAARNLLTGSAEAAG